MNRSKRKKVKALKRMAGRISWGDIKPVTKVIPNKKKPVSMRKAKHKGRLSEPAFFFGSQTEARLWLILRA